jgi:hypothetical protein
MIEFFDDYTASMTLEMSRSLQTTLRHSPEDCPFCILRKILLGGQIKEGDVGWVNNLCIM